MIIAICREYLAEIKKKGININNTVEKSNVLIEIQNVEKIDLTNELYLLKSYYDYGVQGESWEKRKTMEQDHYDFLKYALAHKIKEVQYFHKDNDITSRKFIVFSGDCINCINVLFRKNKSYMNVFMRSSDCLKLLPIDIFNCMLIFRYLISRFDIDTKSLTLSIFITSMHYYKNDIKSVMKVIEFKNG